MMFVVLMGGGPIKLPGSVWQSAHYDRPKRHMLKAAILNQTEDFETRFPLLKDDLLYIIGQADTVEEARNNAIHAPLLLATFGPLAAAMTGDNSRLGKSYALPDTLCSTRALQNSLLK